VRAAIERQAAEPREAEEKFSDSQAALEKLLARSAPGRVAGPGPGPRAATPRI
jgi:hypothetical protein